MRSKFILLVLVFLSGIHLEISGRAVVQESDTLIVEWSDDGIHPVINRLHDTILADTLPDGSRPVGRVYKLLKGGYYWNKNRIDFKDSHLRLIGEKPDPNDSETGNPAVLQLVSDGEQAPDTRMIVGSGDLTLKNLYILGCDDSGNQDIILPIDLSGEHRRYLFSNVIFERNNFPFIFFNGNENDIFFTDNVFRNLIGKPSVLLWLGRAFWMLGDQDTVIVENNTFFNIGGLIFEHDVGSLAYMRFNHNTLINFGRGIASGNWWREAYFVNNLFINGFWHGEGHQEITDPGRDPDAYTSGIFEISALPSAYGPEEIRRIVMANTAVWRDPTFSTYYADSIRVQPLIGTLSRENYIEVYDCMVAVDTLRTADPEFTIYPSDIIENMIQNITDLRAGETPAETYFWQLPENQDGTICDTCITWPLPENFSFTRTELLTAGTDGLPLGDLNWFPAQRAEWDTNKDQYISDIDGRFWCGPGPDPWIYDTFEAEEGTLSGDATIMVYDEFTYFQVDGPGFIEWRFNLENAGQYDLDILTHLRGNEIRGQRIIVNDVHLHECYSWGEYIWDSVHDGDETCVNVYNGIETDAWIWTKIIQDEINEAGALTLNAGENTIRIEASWGGQNFAQINLLEVGTENIVAELTPLNVTDYDIVVLCCEGDTYPPSGLRWVNLNASGSITWEINNGLGEILGAMYIAYQAPHGTQFVTILVNDQEVISDMQMVGTGGDSSWRYIISDNFTLPQGMQEVTLSGSLLGIDKMSIWITSLNSISDSSPDLPNKYTLFQNYPNPFNPTTNISYELPFTSHINISVYNLLGQKVVTLVAEKKVAGHHQIEWNATDFASGIYYYQLCTNTGFIQTRKLILLK